MVNASSAILCQKDHYIRQLPYLSKSEVCLDVLGVQLKCLPTVSDDWLRLFLAQVTEAQVEVQLHQHLLPLTLLLLILQTNVFQETNGLV